MEQGPQQLSLELGAKSFYEFLAAAGNIIPYAFALLSLIMCIYTGRNIYRMVQREGYGPSEENMTGQIIGFIFGALLGITTIVTYAISGIWTGLWS